MIAFASNANQNFYRFTFSLLFSLHSVPRQNFLYFSVKLLSWKLYLDRLISISISKGNKFEYGVVIYDLGIAESKSTVYYLFLLKFFLYINFFLNQVRTGLLKIEPVWIVYMRACACVCVCVCVCVCMYVCLPPRLLITSGLMWCDMDLI